MLLVLKGWDWVRPPSLRQNPNFDRKFVSWAPLRFFLLFEFAMSTHKVVSDNSVPIIHLNRESFTEQDLHQKAYLGKTVNLQIKSRCSPQEKLHFRIPDRVKGSTFCSRFVETFPILTMDCANCANFPHPVMCF